MTTPTPNETLKLFNHSQRGLLYSENWPCQPIEAVLETLDGIGNNGWIKKQTHHIAKTMWDKAISSALKVANEEEVKFWITRWATGCKVGEEANFLKNYYNLKPDTFYEIPGATASWDKLYSRHVFIHLPQENKPENSDPFNHTDSLIKEL